MKKLVLALCVGAFAVSAVADELSLRLGWNCNKRMKLQNNTQKAYLAECLAKLENMVAQQGSQATIEEYKYIWSPSERDKAFQNITAKIAMERGYKDLSDAKTFKKVTDEWIRLEQNDDYQTLACLYIGNPNTKCLK